MGSGPPDPIGSAAAAAEMQESFWVGGSDPQDRRVWPAHFHTLTMPSLDEVTMKPCVVWKVAMSVMMS